MALEIKDLYWVAGILEADGSFYISHSDNRPKIIISLGMKDYDVVKEVFDIVKIGRMTGPNKKEMWTWNVSKQEDSSSLMMTLFPLMKERRQEQIWECLQIWKSYPYPHQRPCPQGHLMEGDNLYSPQPGQRRCRICMKATNEKRKMRRELWR